MTFWGYMLPSFSRSRMWSGDTGRWLIRSTKSWGAKTGCRTTGTGCAKPKKYIYISTYQTERWHKPHVIRTIAMRTWTVKSGTMNCCGQLGDNDWAFVWGVRGGPLTHKCQASIEARNLKQTRSRSQQCICILDYLQLQGEKGYSL